MSVESDLNAQALRRLGMVLLVMALSYKFWQRLWPLDEEGEL